MRKTYFPFYCIVAAVFLFIVCPHLFSHGMFMDGLMYATISRNLAEGIGSFWHLHFSATLYPVFHEHPPLAFGLESLWFRVFGDHFWVERLYSFSTFIVSCIIIVKIWKQIIKKDAYSTAWLPLLFFLIIPIVGWCASNNMLENTMTVFILLSAFYILKSLKNNRFIHLIIAGICIFLAFLTKGFPGLFTFSIPFWLFIFRKESKFRRFCIDSFVLLAAFLFPLVIIYFVSPFGFHDLIQYVNHQVVGSLKNAQTVKTRFFIINRMFDELIPVFILIVVAFLLTLKKHFGNSSKRTAFIYFAIGLSGIVPIMVSMKQSGYYILGAYPFLVIGLSLLILPRIESLLQKIKPKGNGYRSFRILSVILLVLSVSISIYFGSTYGRDKDKIQDVRKVSKIVHDNKIIAIEPKMYSDWSFQGYFSRLSKVSLDDHKPSREKFLLVYKGDTLHIPKSYKKVGIKLNLCELYEREN